MPPSGSARSVETGTVFMNRCDYLDPGLAWTGVKETGRGATLVEDRLRNAHPPEKLSPASRVMDLRANWNYPTSVRFGAGRISELADAVKAAGMSNPLFVTDPSLAKLPMTQKAAASLSGAKIFSDIKSNPVEANVTAGVAAFKARRA